MVSTKKTVLCCLLDEFATVIMSPLRLEQSQAYSSLFDFLIEENVEWDVDDLTKVVENSVLNNKVKNR